MGVPSREAAALLLRVEPPFAQIVLYMLVSEHGLHT
jgi:hypothetical protein